MSLGDTPKPPPEDDPSGLPYSYRRFMLVSVYINNVKEALIKIQQRWVLNPPYIFPGLERGDS
jgi:hypothetical protein